MCIIFKVITSYLIIAHVAMTQISSAIQHTLQRKIVFFLSLGLPLLLYMWQTALWKNHCKERGNLTTIPTATKLSWTLAGMLSCMEIQQLSESTVTTRTVRGFKKEVNRGELMPDQLHHQLDVTTLPPPPKRGRPSLLGDIEKGVMEYIKALKVNGQFSYTGWCS